MIGLTFLKSFDGVALLGDDNGKVYEATPQFANDTTAPIKRDAVPVSGQRVITPDAEFDLKTYRALAYQPDIGGKHEFVEIQAAFDEAEKVWYVKE